MGLPIYWRGAPVLTLALTTTVFHRVTPDSHLRVLEALDRFLELADGRLTWWGGDPANRRWARYAPDTRARIRGLVDRPGFDGDLDIELESGEQHEDVAEFRFEAYGGYMRRPPERRVGHVSFYLPVDFWAGRDGSHEALFQAVCETLQPIYGYAAIGVAVSSETYGRRREVEWVEAQMANRNPGLMIEHPPHEAEDIGDKPGLVERGVKTAAWLTALGDRWAADLGGPPALAEALGPEFALRPYPGGVVVQCGPEPLPGVLSIREPRPAHLFGPPHLDIDGMSPPSGDVGEPVPADAYPLLRRLNGVLRPVRLDKVKLRIHADVDERGGTLNSLEASQRWLTRLD